MKIDEQITWLNTIIKIRIAPSPLHGVGIFAIRDIPKGQRIYANLFPQLYNIPYSSFGKLFPEIKNMLLERWPRVVTGSAFAYPDANMQAYMNHDKTPNYNGKTDVALRDIKEGEEITEDYSEIEGYEKVFPWIEKE